MYPTRRRSEAVPAGSSEDGDRAARDDLNADDRAHQRGLAAPARPHETGDAARVDLEREAVEHGNPAANDAQPLDGDCGSRTRHSQRRSKITSTARCS